MLTIPLVLAFVVMAFFLIRQRTDALPILGFGIVFGCVIAATPVGVHILNIVNWASTKIVEVSTSVLTLGGAT